MSRLLRFDVAGSVHHVTNRGIERRDIVRDDTDRQEFVRLLGRIAARHRWRVFAWVLMDNHFHLFFRLEVASLSAGMHDLESGYASLFNRRHERDGALFQGDRQMKTYQYKPDAQASAFYRNADKACTRLRVGLVLAVHPVGFLLPLALLTGSFRRGRLVFDPSQVVAECLELFVEFGQSFEKKCLRLVSGLEE